MSLVCGRAVRVLYARQDARQPHHDRRRASGGEDAAPAGSHHDVPRTHDMIAANDLEAGRLHLVLIEGPGKKKAIEGQQAVMLTGKTDGNKRCMVSSALISEWCVVG